MIRVLVCDDHLIVRQGIRQVLAEAADVVVMGEASTGPDAIAQVRAGRSANAGPCTGMVVTTDSSHAASSSRIFSGGPMSAISSTSFASPLAIEDASFLWIMPRSPSISACAMPAMQS